MEQNELSVISDQSSVIGERSAAVDLMIEDIYTEFRAETAPVAQVHELTMQDVQTVQKSDTK